MPHIERASFSGHETFPFRYTWLKKAADQVIADPSVFRREDAMVLFGTGKNMVTSIRHWALLTGVIEEDPTVSNNRGRVLRVTDFGHRLFEDDGWDPYLEDPATLWLLHWRIANQPTQATTWYWVFNQLGRLEFDRQDLVAELLRLTEQHGWKRVAQSSVKRDVDCFLRTYVPMRQTKRSVPEDGLDCPLVELGLLTPTGSAGTFHLRRSDPSHLAPAIFAYALVGFISSRANDAQTVALEEVLFAPGSPGRVFCLTEGAVMQRLEALQRLTKGKLSFDETAGLKQVVIHDLPEGRQLLDSYYRRHKRGSSTRN